MARKMDDAEAPSIESLAREKWQSSGLTDEHAAKLLLKGLTGPEVAALVGGVSRGGLHIPYFDEHGQPTGFCRVRYLDPPTGWQAQMKKPDRFRQTAGSLNEIYLPPLMERSWADVLADPKVDLVVTEGELKAACATANGFPTIGLGGVNVWKSKKLDLPLLPQLAAINWKGRRVCIVFDSDAATKPDVERASEALALVLADEGADATIGLLPHNAEGKKQGLDDLFVNLGTEAATAKLREVIDAAKELPAIIELVRMNQEVVLVNELNMLVKQETGQLLKPRTFYDVAYADRTHLKNGKEVQTAKEWLKWKQRAVAQRLVYLPSESPLTLVGGNWNTWTGLGVRPKRGDISPWEEMVRFVYKGLTTDEFRWFEQWCAFPLQNLGVKMFSCVVCWGPVHGTGKSQVGYILRDIYGANGIEIRNKHLSGDFNAWAKDKTFVMGDEITSAADGRTKRVDADTMKQLITQERVLINQKHIDEYETNACANFYLTSNAPDAFVIEDTDRRYFVNEVVGPPGKREMYDRVDRWRKSEGPSYLLDHLLRVNLSGFDPAAAPPETAAKRAMTYTSKSSLQQFVADLAEDPTSILSILYSDEVAQKCDQWTVTELLVIYNGMEGVRRVSANVLGTEMYKVFRRRDSVETKTAGRQRLYTLRNTAEWVEKATKDLAKHYDDFTEKKKQGRRLK